MHKMKCVRHLKVELSLYSLGNMWAQTWNNLDDIMRPFKHKQSVDVTPALVQQVIKKSKTAHKTVIVFEKCESINKRELAHMCSLVRATIVHIH